MRMFENRVLRKVFEPKRDEVAADWKTLHNEKLHNLYSSTITFIVLLVVSYINSSSGSLVQGCMYYK
jgi:hypothetical protein